MTIIHLGTQILPEFVCPKDASGNSAEILKPNINGRPIVLTDFTIEAWVKVFTDLEVWRKEEEAKRAPKPNPEGGQ